MIEQSWRYLGEVGYEGIKVIITDSENFPKFFDPRSSLILLTEEEKKQTQKIRAEKYPDLRNDNFKKLNTNIDYIDRYGTIDLDKHPTCVSINNYSGYKIPWIYGAMGKFEAYGNCLSNKVIDILVYNNLSNINKNSETKIRKVCSIEIYSGCIGIDEPVFMGENELLESKFNLKCPQGNGHYDISQIEIVQGNEFQKEPFGTAVNLSGENSLSEERVQDLINFIKKRSESKII